MGRGFEDVPGKPLGWAWNKEREEILAHLQRKLIHKHAMVGARKQWNTHRGLGLMWAVDRIQMRLHRSKPSMRERQARIRIERAAQVVRFTVEELAMIAEHFAGANDPVAQAIWKKASVDVDE